MPSEDQLRMFIRILSGLKWILATIFYVAVIATFKIYGVLLLTLGLALVVYAYQVDKEREGSGKDDFSGGWLFFRYGEQVESSLLPIPAKPDWNKEETANFGRSLCESLAASLRVCLPPESVQVGDRLITDQETGEQKAFVRVLVRSRFGSTLTHFVHFAPFGRTITAHYFTYVRGPQNNWELFKFVFLSPLTIWLWGLPFLLNRYSILSEISKYRASSFDGIDLRTMHNLTHQVVLEETERLLSEAGLLTEEVKQHINYIKQTNYITNNQRFEGIQVSGSSSVSLGNVNQTIPSLART